LNKIEHFSKVSTIVLNTDEDANKMNNKKEIPEGYVKKETVLMVAGIAIATGFLMGVVFSAYKSPKVLPVQSSAPAQPPAQDRQPSVEMAARIFELEKQIDQNSENADFWIQLGNLYFDTDNYQKSIDAYRKSLVIKPNNANVWTDLGVMYRRSNKPDQAVKAFDRAAEIDPRHETARFNKGIVLLHDLNDMAGAVEAWESLVAVNPAATTPGGQPVVDIIKRFKAQAKAKP